MLLVRGALKDLRMVRKGCLPLSCLRLPIPRSAPVLPVHCRHPPLVTLVALPIGCIVVDISRRRCSSIQLCLRVMTLRIHRKDPLVPVYLLYIVYRTIIIGMVSCTSFACPFREHKSARCLLFFFFAYHLQNKNTKDLHDWRSEPPELNFDDGAASSSIVVELSVLILAGASGHWSAKLANSLSDTASSAISSNWVIDIGIYFIVSNSVSSAIPSTAGNNIGACWLTAAVTVF